MIDKVADWINESENIVFFGGAGVSTSSGIPDFRSAEGIYNQDSIIPPETILSHDFFMNNPDIFYKFCKEHLVHFDAKPNSTHVVLAKLEEIGKISAVITQNIDNLHQKAGSKNVIELHGSLYNNYCIKCHKEYDVNFIYNFDEAPVCDCGGIIRPDVTLYGEALPPDATRDAVNYIANCDMLIIGGTSLSVYPAAGFVNYYTGKKLVLINKDKTSYDKIASLVIHENIADVFDELANKLRLF